MARSKKVTTALTLQHKVLPMQEKAIAAMIEAGKEMEEIALWICNTAVGLGMKERNATVHNAQEYIASTIRTLQSYSETANELGYKSLPIALKALSQYKGHENVDTTDLPEVFHKESQGWVLGRPKGTLSKDDKGFPPLRPRDAQLQYKGVLPWLLEAWRMADTYSNGDEVRDELVTLYLTYSPDEFTRLCYMRINDMEEPDLQTELNRRIEKNASVFEVSKALRNVTEPNYGVGGTLEPPTWDD
jgi:hypothetical protein